MNTLYICYALSALFYALALLPGPGTAIYFVAGTYFLQAQVVSYALKDSGYWWYTWNTFATVVFAAYLLGAGAFLTTVAAAFCIAGAIVNSYVGVKGVPLDDFLNNWYNQLMAAQYAGVTVPLILWRLM